LSGRFRWAFIAEGAVLIIGIVLVILGETGRGLIFVLLAIAGFWQLWIVSGRSRVRPPPRIFVAAKYLPLLGILLLASIWIVVTGIGYLSGGEPGSGWWRIALAVLLAVAFLFVLRRALRDYG
jgi:hypothetical protein